MKLIKQVNFKLCVLFVMGIVGFANAQIPKDKKLHFAVMMYKEWKKYKK